MGIVQRIIRNDAAKSDPKEIYNWRVYLLCASVSRWSNCQAHRI